MSRSRTPERRSAGVGEVSVKPNILDPSEEIEMGSDGARRALDGMCRTNMGVGVGNGKVEPCRAVIL